jgi:hypothetical protein
MQRFASIALVLFATAAQAGQLVELPLKKVYVPRTGFNDVNRVEVVAEGELPNPCFTLAETTVEQGEGDHEFLVRQHAWRSRLGACETEDLIDDAVPFTSVGVLGRLEAATYHVAFQAEGGGTKTRAFTVEPAPSNAVDEFPYAVIGSVTMELGYRAEEEVTATLRGFLPATCYEFQRPMRIETQDDVVVVRPILERIPGVPCERRRIAFREEIEFGKLAPGTYLAHVRSRSGDAVYRAFQIWKK